MWQATGQVFRTGLEQRFAFQRSNCACKSWGWNTPMHYRAGRKLCVWDWNNALRADVVTYRQVRCGLRAGCENA
eukprot:154960-Lingulodinium_polyedra.AAC.1